MLQGRVDKATRRGGDKTNGGPADLFTLSPCRLVSSPRRPDEAAPHDRRLRLSLDDTRLMAERTVEDSALAVELRVQHGHIDWPVRDMRPIDACAWKACRRQHLHRRIYVQIIL